MASKRLMTSKRFFSILRRRTGRNAAACDRAIEARGLRDLCVFVCDASGFSRKTHEYGIIHFLSVMTRCYDRLLPVLRRRGATVFSHRADNILAVFEDARSAVGAAVAAQRFLRRWNAVRPPAEHFNVCIGIHRGPVVRLSDDVYGAAVNVAAKIGEDLAGKDEILVTASIAQEVRTRFRCLYSRSTEIGGRTFELHKVQYSRGER